MNERLDALELLAAGAAAAAARTPPARSPAPAPAKPWHAAVTGLFLEEGEEAEGGLIWIQNFGPSRGSSSGYFPVQAAVVLKTRFELIVVVEN